MLDGVGRSDDDADAVNADPVIRGERDRREREKERRQISIRSPIRGRG
jgi:hypothetical protein